MHGGGAGGGGGGGGHGGGGGFSGGHHGGGFSGHHGGHHGGSAGHGHRPLAQNPDQPGVITDAGHYGDPSQPDRRRGGGISTAIAFVVALGVLVVFVAALITILSQS
jgi:hypothetical protein